MKLTLQNLKPRNPFVAASLRRRAGAHRSSTGARRQQDARDLQREVDRLRPSPAACFAPGLRQPQGPFRALVRGLSP